MSNTQSQARTHESFSWDLAGPVLADASHAGPAQCAAIQARIRQDAADAAVHLMSLAGVANSANR